MTRLSSLWTVLVFVAVAAAAGVLAGLAPGEDGPGGREDQKQEVEKREYRPPAREANAAFGWVDVVIDSGSVPLAAYQVDVSPAEGVNGAESPVRVTIVGVEGGAHRAFAAAPYYDPNAIQGEHVIIGAFSLDADLPSGATRVARVHYMAEGRGEIPAGTALFRVKVQAASGGDGENKAFEARLESGK